MMERLDKIIASQGKLSRSDVKKMVKDGRITVDDVTMLIDFLLNGTWAEE